MEITWWTKPEQLDAEQRKVLALPSDGSRLVLGPPGSGKTNLLLLRATFLHQIRIRNIAVITLGRVLREFLSAGVSNYPFSDDRIQTYVRWGMTLLKDNGVNFKLEGDFKAIRASLLVALQDLAEQRRPENIFDCLLIDEAQDFSVEEIKMFRSLSKQIFAVGDRKQRIAESEGSLTHLSECCDSTTELTAHYRSGLKICRVADGIGNLLDSDEGLEASSNYDEAKFPSSVKSYPGLSLERQVAEALKEAEVQIRAYPTGYIGILCPLHADLVNTWNLIERSQIADSAQLQRFVDGYEAFDPRRRVIATTLHGAKGLEFRALHFLAADTVKKFPLQKNMAYTAVSRAKTSLAIYHEGSLPGYFEKGLDALDRSSTAEPSIDALFVTRRT